jgi:hypothetical protein
MFSQLKLNKSMKKKLILSVICTILLSFGAMAKSNSSAKVKSGDVKSKSKKMTKAVIKPVMCFKVELSCGPVGYACGDTPELAATNAIFYEDALCH